MPVWLFYLVYLFKVAVVFKILYVCIIGGRWFKTGSDNLAHLGGFFAGMAIAQCYTFEGLVFNACLGVLIFREAFGC